MQRLKLESAPKRQFNGKPDTERSRSVLINRCLHPSTPLRIQLIGLIGVDSIFNFSIFQIFKSSNLQIFKSSHLQIPIITWFFHFIIPGSSGTYRSPPVIELSGLWFFCTDFALPDQ